MLKIRVRGDVLGTSHPQFILNHHMSVHIDETIIITFFFAVPPDQPLTPYHDFIFISVGYACMFYSMY